MTLHFHWLHAHAQVSRAMRLMLGVVGVSLLFSAVKVLDVAMSGALIDNHVVAAAPAASGSPVTPDILIGTDPTGAGPAPTSAPAAAPVDASLVDVPQATAEAISL